MPRKKEVKRAAVSFCDNADSIKEFAGQSSQMGDKFTSWAHDYAVIKLYREFESLMLDALIGAINDDSQTLSEVTGHSFPKHLNKDVCGFLITGTGYFDFKGRDGLLKTLKNFVPENHYLVTIVKDHKYKSTLEKLVTLRNFAAHNSDRSKQKALEATGQQRMASSGAWLKRQNRLGSLVSDLKGLAMEINQRAPH